MFTILVPRLITYFRVRGCGPEVAEDLVQEVMFTVYRGSSGLRSRELFRPWLYKVARNALLQWVRRNGRQVETLDLETIIHEPEGRSESPLKALQFTEWMAALEADERQIMMLRYIEELEYHEIAETLGLPLGTVQWKIFHSKKKLASRFGT